MNINPTLSTIQTISNSLLRFSTLSSDRNANKKISDLPCAAHLNDIAKNIGKLGISLARSKSMVPAYMQLLRKWDNLADIIKNQSNETVLATGLANAGKQVIEAIYLLRKESVKQPDNSKVPDNEEEAKNAIAMHKELQNVDRKVLQLRYSIGFQGKERFPILFKAVELLVPKILQGEYGNIVRDQLLDNTIYTQEQLFLLVLLDVLQNGKDPSSIENFASISENDREMLQNLKLDKQQIIDYFSQKTATNELPKHKELMQLIANSRCENKEFTLLIEHVNSLFCPTKNQLFQLALINPQVDSFSCVTDEQRKFFPLFRSILTVETHEEAIKIAEELNLDDQEIYKNFLNTVEFAGITHFARAEALMKAYLDDEERIEVIPRILFAMARNDVREAEKIVTLPQYEDRKATVAIGAVKNSPKDTIRIILENFSSFQSDLNSIRTIINQMIFYHGIDKTGTLFFEAKDDKDLTMKNDLLNYFISQAAMKDISKTSQILNTFKKKFSKEDVLTVAAEWASLKQEQHLVQLLNIFDAQEEKEWCQYGFSICQMNSQEALAFISNKNHDPYLYGWAFSKILRKSDTEFRLDQVDALLNHLDQCDVSFHNKIRVDIAVCIAKADSEKAFSIIDSIKNQNLYGSAFYFIIDQVNEIDLTKVDNLLKLLDRCDLKFHDAIRTKIVVKIAKSDFEKAFSVIDSIQDSKNYGRAFYLIIEQVSEIDPTKVDNLLKLLDRCDPVYHDDMRTKIAAKIAKSDFGQALSIISSIQNQETYEGVFAVVGLMISFKNLPGTAEFDFKKALSAIDNIQDQKRYGRAFAAIIARVNEIDPNQIDDLLKLLDRCDPADHNGIRYYIANTVVEADFKKALSIIDSIQDQKEYGKVLDALLDKIMEIDPTEVDGFLKLLDRCDPEYHNDIRTNIAKVIVKADFTKALSVIDSIQDSNDYGNAFALITFHVQGIDPSKVDDLLKHLDRCYPECHDLIRTNIAVYIAKADLTKALSIIDSIQDQEIYGKAFIFIIKKVNEIDPTKVDDLLKCLDRCKVSMCDKIKSIIEKKASGIELGSDDEALFRSNSSESDSREDSSDSIL